MTDPHEPQQPYEQPVPYSLAARRAAILGGIACVFVIVFAIMIIVALASGTA